MDEQIEKLVQYAKEINLKLSQLLDLLSPFLLKNLPAPSSNTSLDQSKNPGNHRPYTLAELSQLSGIPKKTLYNWTSPRAKVNPLGFSPISGAGRKKYFRAVDVHKFLNVSKEK